MHAQTKFHYRGVNERSIVALVVEFTVQQFLQYLVQKWK